MRDLRLHALLAMLATGNVFDNVHQRGVTFPPAKPTPLPPMRTSQRNDPTHWNADPDSGVSARPMTEADAARITAAQARRDRKNAKRLRDAMRGGK